MPKVPANAAPYAFRTPPRCRWLLRFTAAYVLLSAALVGLWFWWDANSRARLDAKIAALKAAGEPTRAEDFDLVEVPDELNAARALANAAAVLVDSFGSDLPGTDDSFSSERALSEGLGSMLDHLIQANEETLCELRIARHLHRSNAADIPIMLGQYRKLAKLEVAAAFHARYHGDDALAAECVKDAFAIARIVSQANPPGMIYELVAASIDGLTCRAISQLTPQLSIGAHAGAASSAQIRTLIHELLDESSLRLGIQRASQ